MSLNWNVAFGIAFLLLGYFELCGAAPLHLLPAAASPLILLTLVPSRVLRAIAVPATATAALAMAGFTRTDVDAGFGAVWLMIGVAAICEGAKAHREEETPAASSILHEALGVIALSGALIAFPVHTHVSNPNAEPFFAPWFAVSPANTAPAWFPTLLFLAGLWGVWLANLVRTGRLTRR